MCVKKEDMAVSGSCKELYMATSMEELNKKVNSANIDCSTPRVLGRSSNALFLAAKDAALERDQEKAYILFMRFMELVKKIRSSKEYKSRKAEYDKMVPAQKIRTALTEAEKLSESLRERYSAPLGKRQKLDSELPQGEGEMGQQVPESSNKPLSAEDLYKKNSSTALVPQPPKITNKSGENGFVTDPPIPTTSLSAQDLFTLLKSSPDDVIVLDCRPRSMFLASHPDGKKYPQWLSVPEEMIKQGVTSDSIAKFLRGGGRKMWKERGSKLAIILVDATTTSAALSVSDTAGLPLFQLRDAIHKYDTSVDLPRPPVYLEGGYTQWYLHYSPVCVGVWKLEAVEDGRRGEEDGRGGGGSGEKTAEGKKPSFDYPSFPEFRDNEDAEVGVAQSQSDQATPTLPQVSPVTMTDTISDPSNSHAPSSQMQSQVVPSAPPLSTPHTVTDYTPSHPPPQTVPIPTYEPPPVMTILSLDDPNLNQEDPVIHLSTMPENQVDQLGNGPVQHQQSGPVPHAHTLNYPASHANAHPVPQTVQPYFVAGQEVVSQAHLTQRVLQHPQLEQKFGTDQHLWQPIMANSQHLMSDSQGHFNQPQIQNVQFQETQAQMHPQNHPQNGQPAHVHILTGQSHPQIGQPQLAHVHPQTGQAHSQPVQFVDPRTVQVHPQNTQPAQFVGPQTQQVAHPSQVQMDHSQEQPVHTVLPHQQTVQPAPQLGQPVLQTGQAFTSVSQSQATSEFVQNPNPIPNQRVAYGSIPNPPGYDQALQLPAQRTTQPPIPPPISLGQNQPNQVQNQYQNQPDQFQERTSQYLSQSDHFQGQQAQYQNQTDQLQNLSDHYQSAHHHQNHPVQYQDGPYQNQVGPVQNHPNSIQHPVYAQQPQPNDAHVLIDPAAAKIQELELEVQRLQKGKDEGEEVRRQEEEKRKVELEQEKRRFQEEKERAHQEVEHAKLVLAQEKAKLTKELEKMKAQVEEERQKAMKESEQLKEMLRLQQSGQKNQRTFTMNQGLPAGWEKKLDRTTGRFYYVDHNSRTTHWNPPASWIDYQAQLQRMKEQQEAQKPGIPDQFSGQTPQYHGVPGQISQLPQLQQVSAGNNGAPPTGVPAQISNYPPTPAQQQPIKKQRSPPAVDTMQPGHPSQTQTGQAVVKQVTPTVDRSNKPSAPKGHTPSVDRSTKPTMNVELYKRKVNNLQPMYGSQGYGLTGLRNLGNTCFMNSTLQCLCGTTPFVSHFLRGSFLKDRNRSNPLGHGGVLADEFCFLMKSMWSGQYRYISPRDFKDAISHFAPTFSGSQQHDSQEFLAFLLDGLHEDMNRVVERRYIQNPDYTQYDDREAAKIAWSLHKKRNDSIIVDLFQGQFRSTLQCLKCQHRSVNFEAFMYLSIPLPPGNTQCSLKQCIKLFTKEERVSGNDQWYCSSCKEHRDASKRIEIWKLPSILLIHLKRFSYEGVWRQKKQNFVDFPFSGLDMSSDVVGARDGLEKYKLFGVSNHFGTLTGGHYTSFCLNPYKQRFYNFDDHEVKEVSHRQVKSAAAYLLFYTSMDLSPPKVL